MSTMTITDLCRKVKMMKPSHSLLLEAGHGLGKSSVVRNEFRKVIAEKHGVPVEEVVVIDKRAAQLDPADLIGGIFMVGGQTFNAPPYWYPVRDDDKEWLSERLQASGAEFIPFQTAKYGILFFDEVNRGRPETMQCLFEVFLDRKLHGIHLPDTWYVMAAINGDRNLYQVEEMGLAMIDRAAKVTFQPTYEEFFDYLEARENKKEVHPLIRNYLMTNNKKIDPTPEILAKCRDTEEKTYSRRAWDFLGEALVPYEEAGESLVSAVSSGNSLEFIQIAGSYIGNTEATALARYIADNYRMLNPEDVLNKYTDTLDKYIRETVEKNAPTLAGFQNVFVDYLKTVKGSLSDKQNKNILKFMEALPSEIRAGFWKKWSVDCPKQSEEWFVTPRRKVCICEALLKGAPLQKHLQSMKDKGIDITSDEPEK